MIIRNWFIYLIVIISFTPSAVMAEMYSYVDDDGVTYYTNVPVSSSKKNVKRVTFDSPWRSTFSTGNYNSFNANSIIRRTLRPGESSKYNHHISLAASHYQVDPLLIKAVIKTESDFNQFAVSRAGAQGLMQLMPDTAQDMRVKNPFDAKQNIYGGTRYLRMLLNTYRGDLTLSIAAYNAGPTTVTKYGAVPPYAETREYVRQVLRFYRLYQLQNVAATTTNTTKPPAATIKTPGTIKVCDLVTVK